MLCLPTMDGSELKRMRSKKLVVQSPRPSKEGDDADDEHDAQPESFSFIPLKPDIHFHKSGFLTYVVFLVLFVAITTHGRGESTGTECYDQVNTIAPCAALLEPL